jgi:signal transduction histidine kinase
MTTKGSRVQFGVAVTLTTILPLLTMAHLFYSENAANMSEASLWAIGGILIVMVCLGYGILIKYPITIINLRKYMESVARGELPSVGLPDGESDITAIQEYFNMIINQMKKRITIIEEQQAEIVKNERQRVMVESLCTACHHLGQPATAISCYLELMKREPLSPTGSEYLTLCNGEAKSMRKILNELQNITEYRTEPYCTVSEQHDEAPLKILSVKSDKASRFSDVREILSPEPALASVQCAVNI